MKNVRTLFVLTLMMTVIASTIIAPRGATLLLLGDADGDGEVCITDATKIQRDVAKITEIEDAFLCSADVDNDGIITILDATIIQRWLVQFPVSCPIGKSVENTTTPTEENNFASVTNSTEKPTTASTEVPTQTLSVVRNNKMVTVDGIAFNISKIPDAITLDDSTGNAVKLTLQNRILSNPADVHIEISGCDHVRRFTYSDACFRENYLASDGRKGIGCDYLISDSQGNEVAWVEAHLTNTAYPYQVFICGFSDTNYSFSVDFYYRNVLLKRCEVTLNLNTGFGNSDETKALVREIESACWKPYMSDKEKLKAFAEYIKTHYTLRQIKCTDGALYTAFAARDLGLDTMLFYPEENDHPDLITYNLYFSTTVPGGHCACLIEYDNDCTMRYDVQGGVYVISAYNS